MKLGILLIVSGPSGSGKTTLCRRLAEAGEAYYSISCTTRDPRPGETNGLDYHFLSMADFEKKAQVGEFLESAHVHGNCYGTLKQGVKDLLLAGKDVIMDIDVQGAEQVRACQDDVIRRAYVDLFVDVPMAELEARLRGRGTDSDEIISRRLKNALGESEHKEKYNFTLISSDRESDFEQFFTLVKALRMRTKLLV